MARRGSRNFPGRSIKTTSGLRRRLNRWRKRMAMLPKWGREFRLPYSSIFIAGVTIGLAMGLGLGLGVAWLDGRRQFAFVPAPVADVAPAETVTAEVAPTPFPPSYVEQTEPGLDDSLDGNPPAVVAEPAPVPPAVVETTPPSVVDTAPPVVAETVPDNSFTPTPLPADPAPAIVAPTEPAWLKNAVASIDPGNRPMIAIVLDDVGAA